MPDAIAAARAQLRRVADNLAGLRYHLRQVAAAVPASPQETGPDDIEGDLDVPTEIRTTIFNVVEQHAGPAIDRLLDSAAYRPAGEPAEPDEDDAAEPPPPIGPIDLDGDAEETRRALRDLVVADHFSPVVTSDQTYPPEVWVPPGTVEEAGLEVFRLHGRWLATWVRLDVPADRPERERRELVLIEIAEPIQFTEL